MSSLFHSSRITSSCSTLTSKQFASNKRPNSPDSALGSDCEADDECANALLRKPTKTERLCVPSPSPTLECINCPETSSNEEYEQISKLVKENRAKKKRSSSESSSESIYSIIAKLSREPVTKIELPPPSVSSQKKMAARPGYVRRPMNAFMIWSQITRRKIIATLPELHNADISRTLGHVWRGLPVEFKEPYAREAEKIRLQHMRDHPDYKYKPKKKNKPLKQASTIKELGKSGSPEYNHPILPASDSCKVNSPPKRKLEPNTCSKRVKKPKVKSPLPREDEQQRLRVISDPKIVATFNPIQLAVTPVLPQTSNGASYNTTTIKPEPITTSTATLVPLSAAFSKPITDKTPGVGLIKGTVLKASHEGGRQFIILSGGSTEILDSNAALSPKTKQSDSFIPFKQIQQPSLLNLVKRELNETCEHLTSTLDDAFEDSIKDDFSIDLNQITLESVVGMIDPIPSESHFDLPNYTYGDILKIANEHDFSWESCDILR